MSRPRGNAGFIRQTEQWHVSLPDESGVPAGIKMHPNKKAAEYFRGLVKTNGFVAGLFGFLFLLFGLGRLGRFFGFFSLYVLLAFGFGFDSFNFSGLGVLLAMLFGLGSGFDSFSFFGLFTFGVPSVVTAFFGSVSF